MTTGFEDIPGYEGLYQIDPAGVVRSIARNGTRGGFLKPDIVCGYEQVTLYKNNTPAKHKVHRLMLMTFCIPSDLPVNHKNGNKTDNRLVNLEYVTYKQNTRHARKLLGSWNRVGEDHPQAKLTRKDVSNIRKLCKTMTQRKVAKMYGISEGHTSRIVNERIWK